MKFIFTFLILAFSFPAHTQNQWFNQLYDFNYPGNSFNDVLVTNDTIVGIGYAYEEIGGQQGVFLAMLDSNGQLIKTKMFLDSNGGHFFLDNNVDKIIRTSDGGYAFVAALAGNTDIVYFYKLDTNWEVQFIKKYTDEINVSHFDYSLLETKEGYVFYGTNQKANANVDIFSYVKHVDKAGELLWENNYFIPQHDILMADLEFINDSTFAVIYWVGKRLVLHDYYSTIKIFHLNGTELQSWNSEIDDEIGGLTSILPTPDGGFIVSGLSVYNAPFYYFREAPYIKLNANFETEWIRNWFKPETPEAQSYSHDMLYDADSNVISICNGPKPPPGIYSWGAYTFLKMTPAGDSIAIVTIPVAGQTTDSLYIANFGGVGLLSSGSIIIGGEARDVTVGNYYPWLVKLSKNGCLDTLWDCNSPIPSSAPTVASDKTLAVYPNPATTWVNIQLPSLPTAARLRVYNATGQSVHETTVVLLHAHPYSLDVSTFLPGLYHAVVELPQGQRWVTRIAVVR